jgi:hypothetical protein
MERTPPKSRKTDAMEIVRWNPRCTSRYFTEGLRIKARRSEVMSAASSMGNRAAREKHAARTKRRIATFEDGRLKWAVIVPCILMP